MPKIEVNEQLFFSLLGRAMGAAELEDILPGAKAELDGWDLSGGAGAAGQPGDSGASNRTLKIELNDTNRPDLWSTAGLARQLKTRETGKRREYPFFSREGDLRGATKKVLVEASVKAVRPFLAGFVVKGPGVSDAVLKDLIQTQEKLAWNFGRKRRTVSMGLYRSASIEWPVSYKAVDPDKTRFVPLQETREMSLRQILKEHPKGKEYAFILEKEAVHPLLVDAKGGVLSYPPIINSADLGAVQVGDTELFVELTGTDLPSVVLAASIAACDLSDMGYAVEPVAVEYEYDTAFGRRLVTPFYYQKPVSVEAARVAKLLGKPFSVQAVAAAVERMGSATEIHGQYVAVKPAEYRNDFLHAVDVVEDVMMGLGMESFSPERPHDFTIGRLSPIESFSRKAKNAMVGLGYQEMIYNYLGAGRDFVERMGLEASALVRISNPMSENFEFVRNSPLPSLLNSEAVSIQAAYPHRLFEVGKVALRDESENYGVATRQYLGVLSCHAAADFNEIAAHAATLLYYLGKDFTVVDPASGGAGEDPRFIPGRYAAVLYKGKRAGV
ncbi:MAG: phenylalanine--tRNA ligase subunit beta, partial [Spirochaetaceae bacterium]|nr:phenylalanine--tRNA ligase subunit beta [Spirochaetaceae bacterium]